LILAGDIGGTNTRLALVDRDPREAEAVEIYPSREHDSFEEMLTDFVEKHPAKLEAASIGVAGPVRDGRADVTNLAWPVDSADVAGLLGLDRVFLLNDLEASAWGTTVLGPEDFHVLNTGAPDAAGNAGICSVGTGLGEAGLYWDGTRHHPFACEGGHTDFAPLDESQEGIRRILARRYGHVSYERVCSGPGLVNIYRCFSEGRELPATEITEAALAGSDETAVRALDTMVSIYGAESGNLALKLMATGGIYLGGGIPSRILSKLEDGRFIAAFKAKGRFEELLETIPVRVILNDRTALMGAAVAAARALGRTPA
jgi:glucokinase